MDFCILELIKNGDRKILDISNKLYLNLPAISEKIANLEGQKLLTKVLGEDKREKHLQLTSNGKAYLQSAYEMLDKHCLKFLTVLNAKEKESLEKILFKLINS
jgi:DNA-binding MarR family transcriptional regulator